MKQAILLSRLGAVILLAGLAWGAAPVRADEPVSDPWEGLNRRIFAFNDGLDRALLKPVAKGYRAVTPQWLDDSISNFFANIREVPDLANHLLQGRLPAAATDGARFLVNSTVGFAGMFDVASEWGLAKEETDFGLTFARWGVGAGPYVVLPVFGPSTLRDGAGRAGDFFMDPIYYVEDDTARLSLRGTDAVDGRADILDAEQLITGDRYTFLRNLYLQRRQFQIDGKVAEPDFDDEEF